MIDGAGYVLKRLEREGVRHFFTVPGAHLDPLFRACGSARDISPVVCSNESSAGYMADGSARSSGILGVVITHGSPGAHNVVTAIKTAYCENVPLLCISGDVPAPLASKRAFHNASAIGTDDEALFTAMTKFSSRVATAEELPALLDRAIAAATTRPFGPVHLVVPFDVFSADTGCTGLVVTDKNSPGQRAPEDDAVTALLDLLRGDRKVVVWVGDSLNQPRRAACITSLVERFALPVVTTYGAKGVLPEDHRLCFGNFGFGGSRAAQALLESDEVEAIVALDVDWSERNTANWTPLQADESDISLFCESFVKGAPDNVSTIECDIDRLLIGATEQSGSDAPPREHREKWIAATRRMVREASPPPAASVGLVEPETLVRTMREMLPRDTTMFVDAGLHRLFAGRFWSVFEPGKFFTSSVMAATGWAIGAGIGAALEQDRDVVILTGDGCMRMNGLEILTAVKYRIPVTVVIMDNGGFASIHRRLSDSEAAASGHFVFDNIDWAALARSLGAEGHRIETRDELVRILSQRSAPARVRVLSVATPLVPHLDSGPGDVSAYA